MSSKYRAARRVYDQNFGKPRAEVVKAIAQMLHDDYGMKLKPTFGDRFRQIVFGHLIHNMAPQSANTYYATIQNEDIRLGNALAS